MKCTLQNWTATGGHCPFGTPLPGDVTFPSPELSVRGAVNMVAVAYSFNPYLLCATVALLTVVRRGTRELSLVCFFAIITATNELFVKRLWPQSRPYGSCLTSCGMPSSHSAISIGYFLVVVSEAVLLEAPARDRTQRRTRLTKCQRFTVHLRELLVTLGFHQWDENSRGQVKIIVAYWAVMLLPVPFSRMILHDHSLGQVTMGGIVGMCWAFVFVYLTYTLRIRYNHILGQTVLSYLIHNMALPCSMAEKRCNVKFCPKRDIRRFGSESIPKSADPRRELEYYHEQTKKRMERLKQKEVLDEEEADFLQRRLKRLDGLIVAAPTEPAGLLEPLIKAAPAVPPQAPTDGVQDLPSSTSPLPAPAASEEQGASQV